MRSLALVRAGAVISIIAKISSTLHRPGRQGAAVLDTCSFREFVDIRRDILDHPMPPAGRIAVFVRIE